MFLMLESGSIELEEEISSVGWRKVIMLCPCEVSVLAFMCAGLRKQA